MHWLIGHWNDKWLSFWKYLFEVYPLDQYQEHFNPNILACVHYDLIDDKSILLQVMTWGRQTPGPWFNIDMSSWQYSKSHCGDKTVVRLTFWPDFTFSMPGNSSLKCETEKATLVAQSGHGIVLHTDKLFICWFVPGYGLYRCLIRIRTSNNITW